MNDLANTTELVKAILINNPKSRNSDNYLFYIVCKTLLAIQGVDIDQLGFKELFLSIKKYSLPQFETVGRARRKLQSTNPELTGSTEVSVQRMFSSDTFSDYGKDDM